MTHFAYSGAIGSDGTTTVTDPLGHARSWSYTWPAPPTSETAKFGYRLTSFTDALGRQTQYAAGHSGSNLITQITDYRGRIITQGWDYTKGNLTSRTTPTATGGTATTTWTYASIYNVNSSVTDPLGRTTTATVDPNTGNVTDTYDARNDHTRYAYNSQGDLTSTTDPLNEVRYLYYGGYGMVTSISDGTSTIWRATYDNDARKLSETDANGKTTQYSYDSLDRLTAVTRTHNGQAVTTSFTYDADSNRIQLTDPNNHVWQWAFDSMDRTSQEVNPLSQSTGYVYDQAGNLQTRTDGLNQQWVLAYDPENRISSETLKSANGGTESTVSYSYDSSTHLLSSVNDSLFGTTSWTYDSLDRPITEAGPNGSLTFTLNPAINRRDGLQAASQGAITYGHDNCDNITSIAESGLTTAISYDGLNRPLVRTLPSGVKTQWYYDTHGFVSQILSNNGSIDGHAFTRDAVGNVTQETLNGQTYTYGYDDLYRLTSASVMGTSYAWVYDLAGNRTQQTAGSVVTNYTVNAADQLTAVNGTAVLTDANGNVTQDETGGLYTWDVRGRLSSLARSGVTSLFGYNQDNLRVSKTVNGTQTTYLLDGDDVVRENTGGVTTDLLQGPGIDNLLERGSNWILPCGLGSTSTVLDGSGNVLQRYYYYPFGQLSMQGGGSPQPYQFTGREADESGLMYYRARYYNPNWGRFVSRDPIGVGGLADVAALASVRDRVQLDDGMQPGAPGAVPGEASAAGSPWEQGDPARMWDLGVHVTAPAWATDAYVYASDNPVTNTDPFGKRADKKNRTRLKGQDKWSRMDAGQLDAAYNDPKTSKADRQRIKQLQKELDARRHRSFVDLGEDAELAGAGVLTYEIVIWRGATLLAPATGGWSYAGALALQ